MPGPVWRLQKGWLRCPTVERAHGLFLGFSTRALGDMKKSGSFRAALRQAGLSVAWTGGQQVHGTRLLWTSRPAPAPEGAPRTDGVGTTRADLPLRVFAADCAPVFIVDARGRGAALLHAGWRGTLKGILPKALRLFRKKTGARKGELWVLVGPCIRSCCYEVGIDVARFFPQAARPRAGAPGKFSLDLSAALRAQALREGVAAVRFSAAPRCTACDRRFHSYRRDATAERGAAVFVRRGVTL